MPEFPCFSASMLSACLLAACNDAAQRPIPAELAVAERSAHRQLPMDGADNFRDLGGYRNASGQRVKWGLLHRSDALGELSDADRAYMQRLGIRRVVDFRSDEERREAPSRWPSEVQVITLPIGVDGAEQGGGIRALFEDPALANHTDFGEFLVDANRAFVNEFSDVWRRWLLELAEAPDVPTVFHCTAGKDRTGFAAALTLSALGVPTETIFEDYMLSAPLIADKVDWQLRKIRWMSLFRIETDNLRPLLSVERRYLEAAFSEIDRQYGSMAGYISDGLGISEETLARLRNHLLEG